MTAFDRHVFRVLQINDVHLSDQPPRMRTPAYREQILDKLEAAMALVHPRLVHHVVITGDLFHRHQASHTSHETVQRVRRILNAPGIPVSLVVGNHDKARGGVLEGQPLLSVLGDNVTLLEGPHLSANIAGFGWTNELAGTEEEIEAYLARGTWNVERSLVFVHAPIVPEPFPFGPAPAGWVTIEKVLPHLNPETVYLGHGHIHGGHRVHYDSQQTRLVGNPGALSRATIAGDDQGRAPAVALITFDEQAHRVEVEYIALPHVPAEEAFLVAQHAREEQRGDNIAALAAALVAGAMHVITPEFLTESVRSMERPEHIPAELWSHAQDIAVAAIEEATK